MKTTRLLIPAMALAASTLLMSQETPGQPPKRKPAPVPIKPALPPTPVPVPAEPEAFPAPGDPIPTTPVPTQAAPTPTPVIPTPVPAVPALTPVTPSAPIVPPVVKIPTNEPQGKPFIGVGTINGMRVSARGKATIFSALVFQFNKNEPVNIVEEININNPKAGEPRKWLRVQVPADAGVWVHADFLSTPFKKNAQDANGQPVVFTYAKVKANMLNVRGGAGEHFPIIGKHAAGAEVQISGRRNEKWVELFAPANTTVYVAAQFVTRKQINEGVVEIPPAPLSVNPSIPPAVGGTQPTTPTTPPETIVTIPTEAFSQPNGTSNEGVPIKRASTPSTPAKANNGTDNKVQNDTGKAAASAKGKAESAKGQPQTTLPAPISQPAETVKPSEPVPTPKPLDPIKVAETNPNLPPASTEKPGTNELPIRIVTREGYVRRTLAIQAPSGYVLEHIESGKKINYLLLDHATLKLNWFIGKRVLVSGQEAIDTRHANTPVLKVKTLKGEVSKEALTRITVTQAKEAEQATEDKAEEEAEPKSGELEKSDDK